MLMENGGRALGKWVRCSAKFTGPALSAESPSCCFPDHCVSSFAQRLFCRLLWVTALPCGDGSRPCVQGCRSGRTPRPVPGRSLLGGAKGSRQVWGVSRASSLLEPLTLATLPALRPRAPAAEGPAPSPRALLGVPTVWGVRAVVNLARCLPIETKPGQQL